MRTGRGFFVAILLAVGETVKPGDPMNIPSTSAPQNITSSEKTVAMLSQSSGSEYPADATKRSTSSRPTTTTIKDQSEKKPKIAVSSSASASLRRIKKEYKDVVQMGICYDWVKGRLITSSTTNRDSADVQLIVVGPLATNLRHWHFSFRGVKNSLYESGIYHGRILLPKDYPTSPPRVQLMTPSGRFKPFADICLSASAFHPESWTPQWTVLSLVHALRLHMLTNPQEIGGVMSSVDDTLEYARRSLIWKIAWIVGSTKIVVDHATLIQQGALAIDMDQNEPEATVVLNQASLDVAEVLKTQEGVQEAPGTETRVNGLDMDGSAVDVAVPWDQNDVALAVKTVDNVLPKDRQKRRKAKASHAKVSPTVRIEQRGESTTLVGSIVLTFSKLLSTPMARRLLMVVVVWMISKR
jgi:ubiquitin-protein ligase